MTQEKAINPDNLERVKFMQRSFGSNDEVQFVILDEKTTVRVDGVGDLHSNGITVSMTKKDLWIKPEDVYAPCPVGIKITKNTKINKGKQKGTLKYTIEPWCDGALGSLWAFESESARDAYFDYINVIIDVAKPLI